MALIKTKHASFSSYLVPIIASLDMLVVVDHVTRTAVWKVPQLSSWTEWSDKNVKSWKRFAFFFVFK